MHAEIIIKTGFVNKWHCIIDMKILREQLILVTKKLGFILTVLRN